MVNIVGSQVKVMLSWEYDRLEADTIQKYVIIIISESKSKCLTFFSCEGKNSLTAVAWQAEGLILQLPLFWKQTSI